MVENRRHKGEIKNKIEQKRFDDDIKKIRHVCKCGHTLYFRKELDFAYCDVCFRTVYQDAKTEFKYKLLEAKGELQGFMANDATRKKVK